ncbi:TPA: flagellar basal body-associated protein FliL [Escherichia coli]|nr:flagellar basal body-associated protein FliL [Escherichia coli]
MTDYAISKKSKRSLWIPILVFITLAACASAGYSYWHSHQVAADDKAQQRVVPSPVFYALDTFTVNLGDADRVLYIGITLRLKDEATRSRRHCCKVSDEAAFCLIQRPYISKTLLTRRISPRGSP